MLRGHIVAILTTYEVHARLSALCMRNIRLVRLLRRAQRTTRCLNRDAAQGLPPNIGLDNAMYDVARWSARCLLLLLRRVPSLTGACIYRTELTEP